MPTEREQLRKARIGQGRFRSDVLSYWKGMCPVTGCRDERVLVASHIQRWCDSNNYARLDAFNGLALTPNIDRLFDRHLVSFDDQGAIIVAERMDPDVLAQLAVSPLMRIALDPRHEPYMAYHRARLHMLDDSAP